MAEYLQTTGSSVLGLSTVAVATAVRLIAPISFHSYNITNFIDFGYIPALRASYRNPERARWAWYNRAHGSCPWPILDRAEDNAGECAYLDVRPLPPRTIGIMTKQARASPDDIY